MPAPYALIDAPPGNYKDIFDQQAMTMTVIHNVFIRGLNAISAQAPHIPKTQIQPFVHFCFTLAELIHHHHAIEEEAYFPEIEKRLHSSTEVEGSMEKNVSQHKAFLPQLHEYEVYLKNVKEGKQEYDAEVLIGKMNAFADMLMDHLHDEIETLNAVTLRKVFERSELEALTKGVVNRAIETNTMDSSLPLFLVCHDAVAAPWFDDMPWFVVLLIRHWYYRKYKESWEFGPCDLYCKPRDRLKALA